MTVGWQEPAPGEREAGERAWRVVRAAFTDREPVPRRRRDVRPVLILAAAALAAAALGTAGAAVLDAIRGEPVARRALSAVPGGGRLLVESVSGSWVVRADGSKRRLGSYTDPTWSPHGKYVAAARGHELYALTPTGDVRWTLARRGRIRLPSWNGPDGFRIAYLAGSILRVVAGNGDADHAIADAVPAVKPAWKPGPAYILAFSDGRNVRVVTADDNRLLWRVRPRQPPLALSWSTDGRFLLVRGRSSLTVFSADGRTRLEPLGPAAARVVTAAFAPRGHAIAFVQSSGLRSQVWLYPRLRPDGTAARLVFSGRGDFSGLAWSPDGRWLLVAWPSADELLFIRSAAVRKLRAFSGVSTTFGSFPQIAGWSVSSAAD